MSKFKYLSKAAQISGVAAIVIGATIMVKALVPKPNINTFAAGMGDA